DFSLLRWPLHRVELLDELLHMVALGARRSAREVTAGKACDSFHVALISLLSTRRAEKDIKDAFDRGHLSRVWDHNTIIRALEDETLTDVLVQLVEESGGPL